MIDSPNEPSALDSKAVGVTANSLDEGLQGSSALGLEAPGDALPCPITMMLNEGSTHIEDCVITK